MSDLTEFVLARIGEDEAVAVRVQPRVGETIPLSPGVWDYTRVLAECEAKRRIVARWATCAACADEGNRYEARALGWVMAILALPYADHDDYRPEWKP